MLQFANHAIPAAILRQEEDLPLVEIAPGIAIQLLQVDFDHNIRITRARLAGEPADVILAPRLANLGLLDLDQADAAIAEGHRCVRRNIDQLELIPAEARTRQSFNG